MALTATLRNPPQLKELCTILCTVSKFCFVHLGGDIVVLCAKNRSSQVWIQLEARAAFEDGFRDNEEVCFEVHSSSLRGSFRSYDGIHDIELRVVGSGSTTGVGKARAIHISCARTSDIEDGASLSVVQRLAVRPLEQGDMPCEPNLGSLDAYCEIVAEQLVNLAKIVEKYGKIADNLTLRVSRFGVLTLEAATESMTVTTSWTVSLPERYDVQSQNHETGEACVCIRAEDLVSVLNVRSVASRAVIGLSNERAAVVYCYLRAGSEDNMAVFYVSQVSEG